MARIIRIIIVYALWVISAALALFAAYQLTEIFIDLGFVLRLDPWKLRAIRNFGTVTVGLGWLIYVMASEYYFRRYLGHDRRLLRLVTFCLIEVLVVGGLTSLNYGLNYLMV